MEDWRRDLFERMVAEYDPDDYPDEEPPAPIDELYCHVFQHICPGLVYAEPFTESRELRRVGRRYIPPAVKMRVARRDNYMCQEPGCGKALRDFDIEFDHIIPVARGGASVEQNLRVTCFEHNREKGRKVNP